MDDRRKKKQKKKGLLCCTMCGFQTAPHRLKEYEKHLQMHSGDRPFKCDLCSYSTKYRKGVPKHKLRCHPQSTEEPTRQEENPGPLRNRVPAGKSQNKVTSAVCVPEYPPPPEDSKYYKSPYCTFWAIARSVFRDHLSKCHLDQLETNALFSCSLCNYSSNVLGHTQSHADRKHRDREADILIHEELTDEALERHLQQPECRRAVVAETKTSKSAERAERRKRRRAERLSLLAADSVKRRRISVCYKEPSDSSTESDSEGAAGSKKDSLYHCPACSFTAPWKDTMEEHLRDDHSDFSFSHLDLDRDRRNLRSQRNLRDRHQQDASASTTTANYTPVEKADFIETYCCRPCSFATVELDFFHEHMVAHSRSKRYGCTRCGYRTNARHTIEDHVKRKKDHVPSAAVLMVPLNPQVYEKHKMELPYQEFTRYKEGVVFSEALPIITEEEFQRKVDQNLNDNPNLVEGVAVTPEPSWIYCCPKCSWKTDSPKRFEHHLSSHEHVVLFVCSACPYSSLYNIAMKRHIARMKESDSLHESAEAKNVQLSEIKDFKLFMQQQEKPAEDVSPPKESPSEVEKPAVSSWDGASSESAAMTPLRIEELSDDESSEERAEAVPNPTERREDEDEGGRSEESSGTVKTSLASSLRNLKEDFLRTIKGEEPAMEPLTESSSQSDASVETEPAESPAIHPESPEVIVIADDSQSPTESPAATPHVPEAEKVAAPCPETADNLPEPVAATSRDPSKSVTELEAVGLVHPSPPCTSEKEIIDLVDEPESTTDSRTSISVRSFAKESSSLMVCVVESTSSAQESVTKQPEGGDGDVECLVTPSKSMSDRYYALHSKEIQLHAEFEKNRRAILEGRERVNACARKRSEEVEQLKMYAETLTKLQQRYEECRETHTRMSRDLQSERQALVQLEANISAARRKKLLQDIELKRLQVEILQKDMELLGMPESEEKERVAAQLTQEKETMAQNDTTSRARVEVLASMEAEFRSLKEQIEEAEKKFDEYSLREMSESEKALREAHDKLTRSKKIIEEVDKTIAEERQSGIAAFQVFQKIHAQLKSVRNEKNAETRRCKEQKESAELSKTSPGLQASNQGTERASGGMTAAAGDFVSAQFLARTTGQGPPDHTNRAPPPYPNARPLNLVAVPQTSTAQVLSSPSINPAQAQGASVPALVPISRGYQVTVQPDAFSQAHETITHASMPVLVPVVSQQPQQVVFQTQQVVMLQQMAQQVNQPPSLPPQVPEPQQRQPAQQVTAQSGQLGQPPQYMPPPASQQQQARSAEQQRRSQTKQNQHVQHVTLQPSLQAALQSSQQRLPQNSQRVQQVPVHSQQNAPRPRQHLSVQQIPVRSRQVTPGPQQNTPVRQGFLHFKTYPPQVQIRQRTLVPADQQSISTGSVTAGQYPQPQQQNQQPAGNTTRTVLASPQYLAQGVQQQQQQHQGSQVTHQFANGILLTYDPGLVNNLQSGLANRQS